MLCLIHVSCYFAPSWPLTEFWVIGTFQTWHPPISVLSPPVKYFTDRSKAVLLLWIFYVFVLSCVCYVFVRVCLYVLCGHLLGKGWPLGSRLWCLLWVCHFPVGILGQVCYLIVSIPDLCTLTYFYYTYWNIFSMDASFYPILPSEVIFSWYGLPTKGETFVNECMVHSYLKVMKSRNNTRNSLALSHCCWRVIYQSPLILTELFQHNLINVSYLTAC